MGTVSTRAPQEVAHEVCHVAVFLDHEAAVAIRTRGEFVRDDQEAAFVLGHGARVLDLAPVPGGEREEQRELSIAWWSEYRDGLKYFTKPPLATGAASPAPMLNPLLRPIRWNRPIPRI